MLMQLLLFAKVKAKELKRSDFQMEIHLALLLLLATGVLSQEEAAEAET